jgi:hypothetical protein
LVLPLVTIEAAMFAPVSKGSGYEYVQDDGDKTPELSAVTERLRPKPDELSLPSEIKKPGAFIDTLLSENQPSDVADKSSIRKSRFVVVKKMDAEETFCTCVPVETCNDQVPVADCEDKADLNITTSSGTYTPEEQITDGTLLTCRTGRI